MVEVVTAVVSGFAQVFAWPAFGLMLMGIAAGFMVGILPGIGGPTTLALMLPFIFQMTALEAFAFLLGMAAVTATTGDITSILFGIPGEPTTAATIVDGHAMAKQGEAGRALGAALMSSLVGAVLGAFALAMAIPVVRPLVLSFGSPEFFMLAVLGVSFVAALSGGALLKGLIAGGMGLFLATVGMDPISGTQRYTFGWLFLWDGIGLVPVTVGLFAIPELIELAVRGSGIARQELGSLGGVLEGVKDTFRHWPLVARCSLIGAYVGVIPGMGGAVSQWLAYAHAVQSSQGKARFGQGAVEGVLGPGAANNSTLGGALIPTIAFGVPGSVSTAILLGAFIIQGLVPGPDMLLPAPRGHLTLTYALVWIIVIANLITVGVCLLFLSPLAKITHVRSSVLTPFILLLIYLGAFAEKNAFEDLIVVLVFGLLGWMMVQFDWPRPPLLLGLVLGPLAENRLFLATDNYGLAWLWRPGVLGLGAITLAGIVYPLLKAPWRPPTGELSPAPPRGAGSPGGGIWRSRASALFSLAVATGLAWALWQSQDFGFRAGLFPWTIGLPVGTLALVQGVRELTGRPVERWGGEPAALGRALQAAVLWRRTVSMAGWIVGYLGAIWLFGFSLAVPVTTVCYLKLGGRERWPMALALAGLAWALFYGLFDYALQLPFPEGQLFRWVGSGR
jgi:putative tricarboxylic transport membrane protein